MTGGQPKKRAVVQAFRELIAEGTVPTSKLLAERAGVAEDTVRRYLRQVQGRSPDRLPKPPRQPQRLPHLVSIDDGYSDAGDLVSWHGKLYRVRRTRGHHGEPGRLVIDLRDDPVDPAALRTRPPVAG